jgi:hypothetical protein
MTDLSDFIRIEHKPMERALRAEIAKLRRERALLVEALREIDRYAMRSEGGSVVGAGRLARAALAENDWPDGDEVGQPTC